MRNNVFRQEIHWLLQEKYKEQKTLRALKDIERIKRGEPVDYVIGFVEFLGCKIDLSFRPFIPRPETEHWIGEAIQDIRTASFLGALPHISPADSTWAPTRLQKSRSAHIKCLDIFAGSGCIGIAVLKHLPGVHVDFAEKNKILLSQIEKNAKLSNISQRRYRIIQSDVFSKVNGEYDYVFANPPYLATSRRKKVEPSVLAWEDPGALFGGKDGLEYIQKFLKEARSHLKREGTIYMEFDSFQKPAIHKLLKEYKYRNYEFFKDQYEKWRYMIVYEK